MSITTTPKELLIEKAGLFLLIALFVPIEGIAYFSEGIYDILYKFCAIPVAMSVISVCLITSTRRNQISGFLMCFSFLGLYVTVMTWVRGGALFSSAANWIYPIAFLSLFEINKSKVVYFLRIVKYYLTLLLIVNLVFMIVFPKGVFDESIVLEIGRIWLLGYKSSLQYYVMPVLFLYLLEAYYEKKWLGFIVISAISYIESFVSSNAMLLMGLAVLHFLVVAWHLFKIPVSHKMISIAAIGIIVVNITVVGFTQVVLSNEAVQAIIYNLLHKDATLSMRTVLWEATIGAIKEHPIIGWGFPSLDFRTYLYNRPTAHAHNLFIELTFEGGVIAMLVFVIMIIIVCKGIKMNNLTSRAVFIWLICFFVMYVFENPFRKTSACIWMVFMIGEYSAYVHAALSKEGRAYGHFFTQECFFGSRGGLIG